MVGQSTKHELEIIAFVKDLATKELKHVRAEVDKTTGATTTAGKATRETARQTTVLAGGLGRLAGAVAPAALAMTGYHLATRAASESTRLLIDESKRMIRASSEVEEAQSALGFIFEDVATKQEQRIAALASVTGRFTNDIRNFQVELAGIVKPLGFTASQTGQIADELSAIGIDLASFFNKDDTDVFLKLIQGISGETEGMRRLGVDLRDAAVQAEALRLGMGGAGKELTEAQKTVARLSLVIERSSDKIGDAERTADSYANTMRRLDSAVKEARANLGVPLQQAVLDSIESFGGLEHIIDLTTVGLGLISSASQNAITNLRGVVDALNVVTDATLEGRIAKSAMGSAFEGIMGKSFDVAMVEAQLGRLARQLEGITGGEFSTEGFAGQIMAAQLNMPEDEFLAFAKRMTESLEINIAQEKANRRVIGGNAGSDVVQGLIAGLEEGAPSVTGSAKAFSESLKGAFGFVGDVFSDYFDAAQDFRDSIVEQQAAIAGFAEQTRSVNLQTAQTTDERVEAMRAILDAEIASIDHKARLLDLDRGINSEVAALIDALNTKHELDVQAIRDAEKAKALQAEAARQMKDNALAIGALGSGVDNFASAIGSIASGSQTAQEAFRNMARNIVGDIASMIARMAALRLAFSFANAAGFGSGFNQALGTSFVASAKGNVFSGGEVQKFADGGVVSRPTIFPMQRGAGLMGEAGPEAIMPLRRTRDGRLGVEMSGSGGGGSITVSPTIHINAAPGQSERAIAEAVMHQLTTNPQFISAINGAGRA